MRPTRSVGVSGPPGTVWIDGFMEGSDKTSLKGRKKVWSLEQVDPGFKSRLCHHPMAMGKLHNFSHLGFTFYKMGP